MTDLARFLLELIQTLWPLREVAAWEQGVRFWMNTPRGIVGPGIYWVVPYLADVRGVSTVPAVITTPLCTITLTDGQTCTYSLSATLRVTDPEAALCAIDDYTETTQELVTSIPAEALADMDVSRLEPAARGRLLASLRTRVNTELRRYGIEVEALRFVNFALGLRTLRLLTDARASDEKGW